MIHVLDSIEDEQALFFLSFLEDKLRNNLNDHLCVTVAIHAQKVYNIWNFPYAKCFHYGMLT